jgi:ATP-dependent Clp protease ATP-binding subunit ClpC
MSFLIWHYTQGTQRLLEIWKNYLGFIWWYFGVSRHFKTLFSSWKKDISKVTRPGFHPVLWLQSTLENMITRFLGSIVKSFVIIFGLIAELATVLVGFFVLILWIFLPLFLFFVINIFFSFSSGAYVLVAFDALCIMTTIFLVLISFRSFLAEKKFSPSSSLQNLASQDWFGKVWRRVGIDPAELDPKMLIDSESLKIQLRACDITPEEFQKIVAWESQHEAEKEIKKKFWLKENLYNTFSIGENWTYAYTVHLDQHATDLSQGDPTEYKNSKLIGRTQELEIFELILTRTSQNSALLIGEEGVGKRTFIHTLAEKIRKRTCPPYLLGKRMLEINIGEIISGLSSQGQIEDILRSMFFEATYAGNIILVIDNIGHYLQSQPKNAGDDVSMILVDFLRYPTFQVVGLATPAEFHENIEKKESLMKYFERVQMEEIDADRTLEVLLYNLRKFEQGQIVFTFQALREIIKLSDRYITDSPFPEKAIDLMEEVFVFWQQSGTDRFITPEIVDRVVSDKIKVPLGDMQDEEKEKLINLEEILHERVIGQEFAIKQIAETMRRARVGMASATKPIGSFLFLGPTGVGKTESAKSLAEAYFGDEKRMIRLDMSEYQGIESLDRLLGSVEINMTGQLTNKVKENPYALLLLDEIEKAHPSVLDLFLQILDEGWVTDAFGKKINFRNLIIIATSNAGSNFIKESVESGMEAQEIQAKLLDYVIRENIFRPEFLNRFEGVIFFHPLTKEEIIKVAQLQLFRYSAQLQRVENIDIQFDPEITSFVVEKGYDRKFGARSIDRFIQDKIGDKVVRKLINQEIRKGDQFVFKLSDILEE